MKEDKLMRSEQRITQAEQTFEATQMITDPDETVRSYQQSTAEFRKLWDMHEYPEQIETQHSKQLEQQHIL